jgi:hypothetical protein
VSDDKLSSQPQRREGPTRNGGAYSVVYRHDDGGREVVVFDENDEEIGRKYFAVEARYTISATFKCKGCGTQFDGSRESVTCPDLCLSCDKILDHDGEEISDLYAIVDGWVAAHRPMKIIKLLDYARELDEEDSKPFSRGLVPGKDKVADDGAEV